MKQAHAALQQAHKAFSNMPSAYHWRALEAAMMTYQTAYQAAQDAQAAAYDDAEIAAWNSGKGLPAGSEY